MLDIYPNPYIGIGLKDLSAPALNLDVSSVYELLTLCPAHKETPLIENSSLAEIMKIGHLSIKDERERMHLGSFKALGAAFAIAKDAAQICKNNDWHDCLKGKTYIAASAGNHGLSLVAGARVFGARAVIYLSKTVPASFAKRLQAKGAEIIIEGDDYEGSMQAAREATAKNGWHLISDSTWHDEDGFYAGGVNVMQGYLVMADEICKKIFQPPTHIFLQAGVGGFAAAMAEFMRIHWGDEVKIIIVEPDNAPALIEGIKAEKPVMTKGGVSNMGRLDCKMASLAALASLAKTADYFCTISDDDVSDFLGHLTANGLSTSPSGCAGLAACYLAAHHKNMGLNKDSHALCFLTEGV